MSYDVNNPYAVSSNAGSFQPLGDGLRMAGLDKRFLGALVDGLLGMVLVLPGYVMMIIGENTSGEMNAIGIVGLLIIIVGWLTLIGLQIFFLATRSQTVGKMVMKTQIIDVTTNQPAGFMKSFVMRSLVNGLISSVPCIGAIYSIVDICFIFREDRRCLHDLIASTIVLDIS